MADADLKKHDERGDRRWYVNSQGQTFAVIEGPDEFPMGSPESEPERSADNRTHSPDCHLPPLCDRHQGSDGRAVPAVREEQRTVRRWIRPALNEHQPHPDGPWIGATWYAAAAYCNWLSKQEGLPEDQWCYQPKKGGSYEEGMTIPANVVERRGYRLPTEAEWEYACRAGTLTSRYYGFSSELLGKYANYQPNSEDKARPCGSYLPNDLGLFDMLGNVFEWTQDHNLPDRPVEKELFQDIAIKDELILNKLPRLFRGGAFDSSSGDLRSSRRRGEIPTYESFDCGFRIVRTCE